MKYVSNSNYKYEIESIINNRKNEIFKFFDKEEKELSTTVYIYDSIESLVNGLRNRGFSKDPDYMCACFKDEDNSLNFFEPKDNPSDDEWSKEEYKQVVFHELVHAICYELFGYLPEWLNEGIAKYLDGTYSKGVKSLIDNYIKEVPDQREIEEEFGMHDYDSYDYAYIMVCYIIDNYGKDCFTDISKINSIKSNLLNKAINYYKNDVY